MARHEDGRMAGDGAGNRALRRPGVAVVGRRAKNQAKDAAEAVVVNYEELPAVPDIRAAIQRAHLSCTGSAGN